VTRAFILSEAVRFFAGAAMADQIHKGENDALTLIAAMITSRAKSLIGTYSAVPAWPELAQSTQQAREKKGFPANEPLLMTGELRNSIGFSIEEPGKLAIVGSTSDIAVYQELGTSHIPPRSFLVSAAMMEEKRAKKAAGAVMADALVGSRLLGAEFHELEELLHVAKHLAHDLKEDVESAVESKNDTKRHRH
jgi:hypothetical protein